MICATSKDSDQPAHTRSLIRGTSSFVFAVDILTCMCLAALWSFVGKGAKAVVAGPAGAAFAGPTFLVEYAFHHVLLSR